MALSDARGIRRLQLSILDPTGETVGDIIEMSATTWVYSDTNRFSQVGSYTIWIEAEDNAGNITQIGPYQLEVTAPSELYLPLISHFDLPMTISVRPIAKLFLSNRDFHIAQMSTKRPQGLNPWGLFCLHISSKSFQCAIWNQHKPF